MLALELLQNVAFERTWCHSDVPARCFQDFQGLDIASSVFAMPSFLNVDAGIVAVVVRNPPRKEKYPRCTQRFNNTVHDSAGFQTMSAIMP